MSRSVTIEREGVKKWPKIGHEVCERPLTVHWPNAAWRVLPLQEDYVLDEMPFVGIYGTQTIYVICSYADSLHRTVRHTRRPANWDLPSWNS